MIDSNLNKIEHISQSPSKPSLFPEDPLHQGTNDETQASHEIQGLRSDGYGDRSRSTITRSFSCHHNAISGILHREFPGLRLTECPLAHS
jgi:hypothetical protein